MSRLVSEAEVELSDPAVLLSRLLEQFAEYEVNLETQGGRTVAEFGRSTGTLTLSARSLGVRIEAPDQGDLELLRSVFASHIVAFAREPIVLAWSGLDTGAATYAGFREIRLLSSRALTPRMRRLTFSGVDLARFASGDDIHVRLYFPPRSLVVPEWPQPGPDGRTLWPEPERRPATRYYTLRRIDRDRGEFEIDFVLHAGAGPGADFAVRGRPGDVLGMDGPFGRNVEQAGWMLLAGDETALPAIARILEELPERTSGVALIEVDGPEDEIVLQRPPGFIVHWLHREGSAPGLPDRLMPAIRQAPWPETDDVFVWIGCEFTLAKALRRHVTRERGLPRSRQLIVGYWSRDGA